MMKYEGAVLAVEDIHRARKFYEEVFGLELFQDYGINISFTCGLSLQQEFDWLVGVSKEQVQKKTNNMEIYFEEEQFDGFVEKLKGRTDITYLGAVREQSWGQRTVRFYDPDGHIIEVGECMGEVVRRFLNAGMTMEQVSEKMDVSVSDLQKLLEAEA